jgi:hypothetical protein
LSRAGTLLLSQLGCCNGSTPSHGRGGHDLKSFVPSSTHAASANCAGGPAWARRIIQSRRPPEGAAGPIVQTRPSAAALHRLLPVDSGVSVESGLVSRGAVLRNAATGLPGFRWDVPAPDPGKTVLWASLAFDWTFYGWRSDWPRNDGDQSFRFYGSLEWIWLLTGHPEVFSSAPIFLTAGGDYSFYMDLAPGASGFDVGWLTPPLSRNFSAQPDKMDASMTSPLQRLLAMNVNGVLMLWFALDIRNQQPPGYIYKWGPDTLYYAYAYAVPLVNLQSAEPWALSTS